MNPHDRLKLAALVETCTVLILFGNLATAHNAAVASLIGPVHGLAYLVTIVLAFNIPDATRTAKWLCVVPVIGGWLSCWNGRRPYEPRG